MKHILKISLLTMLFLAGAAHVRAQNIRVFRERLAMPDTLYGASVRVTEYGTAADAVYGYGTARQQFVKGYRVRIFFDNSQTARQDAYAVQERFRQQFPDIPSYLDYESPSFIVTVGNCVTIEEALILQNKIKKRFNTAFLWRGEIPLSEFLKGSVVPNEPEPEHE